MLKFPNRVSIAFVMLLFLFKMNNNLVHTGRVVSPDLIIFFIF